MIKQHYARVTGEGFDANAVQWWYFREEPDGWCFARGGNCHTVREARKRIRFASQDAIRERKRFLDRPTHILEEDGSLRKMERGYSL